MSNSFGNRLVNRLTNANVCTRSFLWLSPGEEGTRVPRVIAGTIAVGASMMLSQSFENQQMVADARQRLKCGTKLKLGPFARRSPLVHDRPVGEEQTGHSQRTSFLAICRLHPRLQRLKER
jgi:hypothetical protein